MQILSVGGKDLCLINYTLPFVNLFPLGNGPFQQELVISRQDIFRSSRAVIAATTCTNLKKRLFIKYTDEVILSFFSCFREGGGTGGGEGERCELIFSPRIKYPPPFLFCK